MTEAAGPVDPAAVPGKPSRAGRMIHVLGAALVGVVLPVVLLHVFLGERHCCIGRSRDHEAVNFPAEVH